MKYLVILVLCCLVIGLASAATGAYDGPSTAAAADEDTFTSTAATYFGVDANDEEAVRKKQQELAEENWKNLFGPTADPNEIDFSGQLEDKSQEVRERLQKALKWIFDKIHNKNKTENAH